MLRHRNPMAVCCAAALAAGLAACGGDGDGDGESVVDKILDPPTEMEIAEVRAIAAAIKAAEATRADGTFDDDAHMVSPTVAATHDGKEAAVTVMEAGTPQGGTARSGDFSRQVEDPAPTAGWAGVNFARGDAAERLTVYTDVAAPESAAFTVENLRRLTEVSTPSGTLESGLVVENPGYLPLIRSVSLEPAGAGSSVTYEATATGGTEEPPAGDAPGTGAVPGLSFTGTFSGATGRYACSGMECSVTLDDKGKTTAMTGAWTFAQDDGAMLDIPDTDHLYFGWWLNEKDDGSHDFQTFAGATGFAAGSGDVASTMTGSATYRGAAAGVYAILDISRGEITGGTEGEFTARATLTAHFFGALDDGEIRGEIDAFKNRAGKSLEGWRVSLNAADIRDGAASFAGETAGAIGGDQAGQGSWEGLFHGTDGHAQNPRPSHVTGRFDAHFHGADLAGAFGAARE